MKSTVSICCDSILSLVQILFSFVLGKIMYEKNTTLFHVTVNVRVNKVEQASTVKSNVFEVRCSVQKCVLN